MGRSHPSRHKPKRRGSRGGKGTRAATGTLPAWAAEVVAARFEPGADAELIAWIRARPKPVWPLMVQFPPSSIVRGLRPFVTPAPGRVGMVRGWRGISADEPTGCVLVQDDETEMAGWCAPDGIEVVAFGYGVTSDWVGGVLVSAP